MEKTKQSKSFEIVQLKLIYIEIEIEVFNFLF